MIQGWKKTILGEACRIEKGKASAANEPPGNYPLITTGDGRKSAANWQFEGPAVCVPMISAFGHGKPGLKRVHYQEGKFALANILSALLIKNPEELSAKFLALFLTFYKEKLIVPLQFGAANMSLTVERLAAVPIWFPALHEQKRILCFLDEAEALRRLRQQSDARMEQFVPALFHQMFWAAKYKQVKLGNLATRITKGESPGWQGFTYTEEGPLFITSENVLWGKVDISSSKHIPFEFHQKLKRSILKPSDVLVNLVGASIGRSGVVPENIGEANINQAVAVITPSKDLLSLYLCNFILSQRTQDIINQGKVEAARANISLTDLNNLDIPFPPLALQSEFALRVQEAHALQAVQAKSAERIEALYQSMLSRAFAGEL